MVSGCRSPVNVNAPLARQYDFTRYRLKVGDVGKRVAISQGEMEMSGDTTVFRNRGAIAFSKFDYRGVRTEEYRVGFLDVRVVSFSRT